MKQKYIAILILLLTILFVNFESQAFSASTRFPVHIVTQDVDPYFLTQVEDSVFFSSNDNPAELWKSDGTEAGTVLVKDLTDPTSTYPIFLSDLFAAGDILYFCTWYTDVWNEHYSTGFWRSDGTEDGTFELFPFTYAYQGCGTEKVAINNTLYFLSSYSGSVKLWKSDGTFAETTLIKDDLGIMRHLTNVNGTLFFLHSTKSWESDGLWKSDGTEAGTVEVIKLDDVQLRHLTNVGGVLYFTTYDSESRNYALWKSDGTESNTTLIKYLPSEARYYHDYDNEFVSVGGLLFFSISYTDYAYIDHTDLWVSDGTTTGTVRIKNFKRTWNLTSINETLYFFTEYGTYHELWKSDGTESGTALIKQIPVSEDQYNEENCLTDVYGLAFFRTYSSGFWSSDGTEAGTLNQGYMLYGKSDPYCDFVAVNGRIFLSGSALYRLDYISFKESTYLPIINHRSPNLCEEMLTKDKVWQGDLAWGCDYETKQKGTMSLKITADSPSIAELYSPLIAVQSNQTYEVSYWVKTDLEIDDAELVGRVVPSQYTSLAKETDSLQDYRVAIGFDLGENANSHQEWEYKSYTFTTKAETRFVRLRAIMGGQNGTARGTMWIDNVSLVKQ